MKQERARTWMRMVAGVSVALGLALAAMPAAAQTIRGTITGTVTDSTGAVAPGDHGDGDQRRHRHRQLGADQPRRARYTIPLLASGTYQATVEQSGFKKYVRSGIVVQIAQTTRLDIPLQVGDMSEAVEVVARGAARAQHDRASSARSSR